MTDHASTPERRSLLMVAMVLVPVLALSQEVLWERVKRLLEDRELSAWVAVPLLLLVVVASAGISRWLLRRDPRPPSRDSRWFEKQRTRLLGRLDETYRSCLEQTLEGTARLRLRLVQTAAGVARDKLPIPLHPRRPSAAGQEVRSLLEAYERGGRTLDRGMLVTGGPGAGKTTLLIELGHELVARANADPRRPIPIFVPLAGWTKGESSFESWLVDELHILYELPTFLSRRWIESGDLVLLLDGLDELPLTQDLASCFDAIDTFGREHLICVVASSREDGYAGSARLHLDATVQVRPLDPVQVLEDLRAERRFFPLAAVLADDPQLLELLHSPFMLKMLTGGYADAPGSFSLTEDTVAARRQVLVTHYVQRQAAELDDARTTAGERRRSFSSAETLQWLSWVGRYLTAHQEVSFVPGRLRSDALPTARGRSLVRRTPLLVWGVTFGLLDLLYFGLVVPALGFAEPDDISFVWVFAYPVLALLVDAASERHWPTPRRIVVWAAFGVGINVLEAARTAALFDPGYTLEQRAVSATTYVLYLIMMGEVVIRLVAGERPLTERLAWSWRGASRSVAPAVLAGLPVGVMLGLLIGPSRTFSGVVPENPVATGLIYGISLGIIWGLEVGMAGGLRPIEMPLAPQKDGGIRRSARIGVILGAASVGLVVVLLTALGLLLNAPAPTIASWCWDWAPLVAVVWALHTGLGPAIQKLVLRVLLHLQGALPLRLGDWLTVVGRHRLLYRGPGAGYAFIHPDVQEYFARRI